VDVESGWIVESGCGKWKVARFRISHLYAERAFFAGLAGRASRNVRTAMGPIHTPCVRNID